MDPRNPFYLRLAAYRGPSVGVAGAISNKQTEFKALLHGRNNATNFLAFLRHINDWPLDRTKTVYVMDEWCRSPYAAAPKLLPTSRVW